MAGGKSENIRVCARFRPRSEKEKSLTKDKVLNYEIDRGDTSVSFRGVGPNITQSNRGGGRDDKISFNLDRIYKEESTQDEVFEWISNNIVKHCFEGYNGTIFAYGQTSSGKTHTMFGPDNYLDTPDEWGIVPKSISELFNFVHSSPAGWEFSISTSYFQLYKEKVQDLLKPANNDLKIHESKARGIFIEGLSNEYLEDVQTLLDVLTVGGANKKVASTDMNARSSRGHSVLQVTLVQKNEEGSSKTGKFTFVDLAGSERVDKTNAVGQTFEEAKKINLSLTCLANVIKSLSVGSGHIPYRDSKLTRILQESLGGNTKTMLILCCSPDLSNIEETLSTLRFGKSAKTIKNQVKVNVRRSAQELEYMLKRLQGELAAERKQVESLRSEIDWMKSDDYNPESKPENIEVKEEEQFDIEDRMVMEQELESKQVRIDSLQEELASLQSDYEVSKQEFNDQLESFDQIQATLKKLEAAAKVDFRKIEQLEFELESSKADKTMAANEVDAWKQKLETSNATKGRIQQAADKLKEDIKALEEERVELSNNLIESQKENISLQEQIGSVQEEALISKQASDKLKMDLEHIEGKLSNSEKKASTLADSLRELQSTIDDANEKISVLESELSFATSNLSQKEEEMQAAKEMHEASKEKSEMEIKEKDSAIDVLESKLKDSHKTYEKLNQDFKEQALQLSQTEKDLQRAKKSLEDSKSELDSRAAEYEDEKRQIEERLEKERETTTSLESQLIDLRKTFHRHKNTLSSISEDSGDRNGDENENEGESQASDNSSVEQVEALFGTIDKYKKINQEYAEKNKKLEDGTVELRKEMSTLRDDKKDLYEQIDLLKEEKAKELIELEKKMNTQISEEKERTMDLRTKLMEKRSVLMKLTTEKKNAERENKNSVSEVKSLKSKLDESAEEVRKLGGNIRNLNSVIARIHDEKESQHEAHIEKMAKMELEKLKLGVDIEQLQEQKKIVADQLAGKTHEVSACKMTILKEKAIADKYRTKHAQVQEELESSTTIVTDLEQQIGDAAESSKKEIEVHLANLETSRSMIQKQADHISSLESELKDRDEQIQAFEELEVKAKEESQEHTDALEALQEKYDNLVAEMPMRVRARIFKPVLRGREKALKEKIDLSGVRQKLRRVGRKSFLVRPPPPPPKDDA